jgi:hypothetical protein
MDMFKVNVPKTDILKGKKRLEDIRWRIIALSLQTDVEAMGCGMIWFSALLEWRERWISTVEGSWVNKVIVVLSSDSWQARGELFDASKDRTRSIMFTDFLILVWSPIYGQ